MSAMLNTRQGKAAVVALFVIAAAAAWYLGSPLFLNQAVAEGMPAEGALTAQGRFTDSDSSHRGEGAAKLFRLPDGAHLLRFEAFRVTNGPELHVLLAGNPEPKTKADLDAGRYVDLGRLKGNMGDQNYALQRDLDLSAFRSVVIYCLPFQVIFSTARLEGGNVR